MEGHFSARAIRPSTAAGFCTRLGEPAAALRPVSLPSCVASRRWSPCSAEARPRGLQSQAQAIAVPWDDNYASEWESDTARQQPPLQQEQQQQRQFAVTQRASKPLKINRDLLLVRCSALACLPCPQASIICRLLFCNPFSSSAYPSDVRLQANHHLTSALKQQIGVFYRSQYLSCSI